MVLDASRAGKGEVLEITWKHLEQEDRIPPPLLVKERFCMMLEKEDFDSALACITTNSAGESQAFCKSAWLNVFEENAQRFRKDTLTRLMHELANQHVLVMMIRFRLRMNLEIIRPENASRLCGPIKEFLSV
ncbi:pentatricopeptide repeat-containing protein At1g30610, chloroplastic-like [Populus alba]|uniref:pentatricopeptide repeat-containing protein At1g30610, chloroplastic-like n=1 Tax=Populus alba TaxID=43335 RepID=UPI003CC72FE3